MTDTSAAAIPAAVPPVASSGLAHITDEAKEVLSNVMTRLQSGEHVLVTSVEELTGGTMTSKNAAGAQVEVSTPVRYAVLGFAGFGVLSAGYDVLHFVCHLF